VLGLKEASPVVSHAVIHGSDCPHRSPLGQNHEELPEASGLVRLTPLPFVLQPLLDWLGQVGRYLWRWRDYSSSSCSYSSFYLPLLYSRFRKRSPPYPPGGGLGAIRRRFDGDLEENRGQVGVKGAADQLLLRDLQSLRSDREAQVSPLSERGSDVPAAHTGTLAGM